MGRRQHDDEPSRQRKTGFRWRPAALVVLADLIALSDVRAKMARVRKVA